MAYGGARGWLLLGAIFVVASLAMIPAVRRGQSHREATPAPSG